MPLSYASYAGNGSTTSFSVPFPYILKAHVKVYIGFNILNGTYTSELVDGTGFTWTSGTQIQCTTAPAVGQTLTVIRQTPSSSRLVDWNDGSNLIAADLDTADLQNLYVVQEQQDRNDSGITQSTAATATATAATTAANTATSTANTALSTANTALTNASAAVSTANTASSNASAAVSTANTASTNASAAVTTANAASGTANTASTNASNAVTTANAAAANASTALSTANTALSTANAATSTANTASSNASAAVTTANTASTNASNAVTTANTASTNASAAVSTANTASTNASTAINTANTANNKADQAIAAVSNSINFQLKVNVAAIPASPANDTYIEVQDSTGLESFTPLAGKPAGFVGDSGLSVRLRYTSAGSTWNWLNYYANNSETRYLKLAGGTLTGPLTLAGAPTASLSPATKGYVDAADATLATAAATAQSTADAALSKAGGTMTGAITLAADPVSSLQPATKQYVDTADATLTTAAAAAQSTANAALPKVGGTMTGSITFAGGQLFPGVVTSVSGTAPVTVTGTTTPAISVSAGSTTAAGILQLTDSTASTSTTTAATPSSVKAAFDLATTANTTAGAALPKAGGTMTGAITLAADPASGLQPATKQYVDTANALKAPLASPTFTGTVTIPAGASISGYAPLANPTFTGTVTIPAGASISGYAPLASPVFTGTVTIPAGASISGYAALGTTQSFTKAQRGAPVALTDAATVAVDLSLGNYYSLTLGGNRTLGAPTNQTAGQSGVIVITQDGTGSRTLAYNSVYKFPSGTAPTLTTTANSVDVLVYYVESATRITCRLLSDLK